METKPRSRRDFQALRRRRMQAGALFVQGKRPGEVARLLAVSRQSTSLWYRAWKRQGAKALQGAGRAGRKPRLDRRQIASIERALLRGPQAHGFSTPLWTLPRLAAAIERTTGIAYHPGHVWRLMRLLGWSLQRPARRAAERDEGAIERWKKRVWARVKKTPHRAGPGSSSKTKVASPKPR